MNAIGAIIIGPILIILGICIYKGKLLWLLIDYKIRFKDEPDKEYKRKVYRQYGIIFMSIGAIILIAGLVLFSMGISSTKTNFLY